MVTGSKPAAAASGVAQAGAGGDEVEHLDDLVAEAACELAGAAEGVLAGDPALLVGGGAEREVAGSEESVVVITQSPAARTSGRLVRI